MPLTTADIPQAPRLARIRAVVEAVSTGRGSVESIGSHAGMKKRDARYHLVAASRILGLLVDDEGKYRLARLGRRLLATEPASEEERAAWVEAIQGSAPLRAWAGELLGARAPREETLVRRATKAGLSPNTARQRARAVLRWRKQLLDPPRSSYRPAAPRQLEVRERSPAAGASTMPTADAAMLESLRLVDFKSFQDETVPLAPLTFFVGANASGKSNALDAIRFLQGVALELSVSDILRGRHEGGRLVWPAIRGGIPEVGRSGAKGFALETKWSVDGEILTHHLGCTVDPVPLVVQESLRGKSSALGEYLFDTHAPTLGQSKGLQDGRAINVALKSTGGGRNVPQVHSAALSLLGQIEKKGRVSPLVTDWAQRLQQVMRGATFLSITPSAMREWSPSQALEMGADGENISAVVQRLCEDRHGKRRLVDWISELCAPRVHDIAFAKSDLDDVLLQLVEEDGTAVSARSLSDGTLRFLGELVAVLTAEPGTVLLVEEIENGLHPQRLHLLVELLETVTAERGIQVIATTHSPLVLGALSPRALRNTVLFARIPDVPGSVARRLGDLPHFDEVATRRGAERLFASGWLERAL